ncbi:MAG: cellulase family glycosylhydrolase [Spirochaetes bacterium]|nr:cellulase family glycosylhydrolase [Spirochaetota bacterium]
MKKALFIFLIITAVNFKTAFTLSIENIHVNQTIVTQYNKFELTLAISNEHPEDLVIKGIFTDPSQKKSIIKGFPCHNQYKIRFTPVITGKYSYQIELKNKSETIISPSYEFKCLPSNRLKKGFLKKWSVNPHCLIFDNGGFFYILGENRMNIYDPSWNYKKKGIEDYIKYMKENGMSTLRIFIRNAENINDSIPHGYLEQKTGCYDDTVADQIDKIIQSCEKYDLYLILTVFALGFTPEDSFKDWGNNPYNYINGGTCKKKEDFFTNKKAIDYQEKRLEYIINRYGYSTHLLAIDLFNEPEWDCEFEEDLWIPWAIERAKFVKQIDPYNHLITLGSVGPQWNIKGHEEKWYKNQVNDMIQWHPYYGTQSYQKIAYKMRDFIREYWDKNKPVFCGEFAWGKEDKKTYDHTHNGIWSALLSGGGVLAHSAPPFTPETDEFMTPERAKHFKSLHSFLKNIAWDKNLKFKPHEISTPSFIKTWCLKNENYAVFWLLDGSKKYGQLIKNTDLTIKKMADKSYIIEWWDTRKGSIVHKQKVKAKQGSINIKIPAFYKDIAGKVY